MPTALIAALKGATILDYIMIGAILFIGSWLGWWQLIGKKSKDNPNLNRHMMCIGDIDALITEKREIKNYKVMKEQMKVLESASEEVARLMRDKFFKELVSIVGTEEEVLKTLNNTHYNNVVEIFMNRVIENLRRMMRDNGLAEKSDSELRDYIRIKAAELIEVGRNVFDVYYSASSDHKVTRSRVHDMHKEIFAQAKDVFSSAIWECRRLAIEGEKRMKEIDSEIAEIRANPCPGGK